MLDASQKIIFDLLLLNSFSASDLGNIFLRLLTYSLVKLYFCDKAISEWKRNLCELR